MVKDVFYLETWSSPAVASPAAACCRLLSNLFRAAVARRDGPPRESLISLARRLFGPDGGFDLDVPERGTAPESVPPDFSIAEGDEHVERVRGPLCAKLRGRPLWTSSIG